MYYAIVINIVCLVFLPFFLSLYHMHAPWNFLLTEPDTSRNNMHSKVSSFNEYSDSGGLFCGSTWVQQAI